MLRLKPYNLNDADIILSWSKDEMAFINGQQVFWVNIR